MNSLFMLLLLSLFAGALYLGGPKAPRTMTSISAPFKNVDFSDLPPIQTITAREGSELTYRRYPTQQALQGSIVLVHGSSASSSSMHPLAETLRDQGWQVIAVDIRGRGGSGERGKARYVGQLEHDLEDVLQALTLPRPLLLTGFSSGGGFVLRMAGGKPQAMFDGFLLLAPFLGQDAPTFRPDAGGWVSVGVPRYVGLAILNALGLRAFNDLPVNRFAIDPTSTEPLTASYNFALADNFRPEQDWLATIQRTRLPLHVIVGENDEAFIASEFEAAFAAGGRAGVVTHVPGIGHTSLTVEPAAPAAIVSAAGVLRAQHR